MFSYFRKVFKWGSIKVSHKTKTQSSFLSLAFLGALEDVLFWKTIWLSMTFIFLVNVVFLVCVHQQINLLSFVFAMCATISIIDAFEAWLKYKHRTSWLQRIACHDGEELYRIIKTNKQWIRQKLSDYMFIHKNNPTKAFLIVNILLCGMFILGRYVSGYMITYLISMFICFSKKILPPILKAVRKIQQHADSDVELEGLIPEISDVNLKLLSIEPENQIIDEKQSLDFWKPEDVSIEEVSDSSDSSSVTTNLLVGKMHTIEKDIETSDSSDDEYIPHDELKPEFRSTVEVLETDKSWSGTAYNTLWSITGAVSSLLSNTSAVEKRKSISSADSSDGFEFIDKNDLK